ncbi:hypothetical protein HO173_012676 [Letharia columbiana]|uniref:Small ribosomal subunit protein mS41 n=1 Tax=Letharia columbiana TaxID=112416 RepID=A0A8H6CM38_9LECA|nr:uncharacterized protein HO173_012676 [Letharia columbiana]KAF6225953.1 hypothetical protein HO173_012676 [Letharia columbiana]
MIVRSLPSPLIPSTLQSFLIRSQPSHCLRHLHARASASQPPTPQPTPFVPDASTFLKLIGRNLSQHAGKIPTWQSLFSLTSTQLRELGVEPARTRRYLLWWRDRFRKGIFGVGGDLRNVKDGGGRTPCSGTPRCQSGDSKIQKHEHSNWPTTNEEDDRQRATRGHREEPIVTAAETSGWHESGWLADDSGTICAAREGNEWERGHHQGSGRNVGGQERGEG